METLHPPEIVALSLLREFPLSLTSHNKHNSHQGIGGNTAVSDWVGGFTNALGFNDA